MAAHDDDTDALRAENEELRRELDAARGAARGAEAETGRVRGELAEMHVQLLRARQDQEQFQRVLDVLRSAGEGFGRLSGRLRRMLGR